MASPAEIMQPLPDTLPEDFSEWDGGFPPATVSVNSNPFKAAADHAVHAVESAPPERPAAKQIRVLAVMDGSTPAPPFSATGFYATHDDLSRSKRLALRRAKRKRVLLTLAAVIPILLLLVLVPLRFSRFQQKLASVKQSIVNRPASPETGPAANGLKPSPATLLTTTAQPVANTLKLPPSTQPASMAQPATSTAPVATVTAEETPQQVEPTMMNDQLAAPKRIPRDINVVPKPEAPPTSGFAVAGTEGLDSGGSAGVAYVFGNSNKRPRVTEEIPTRVNISSGVATGLLVQKTMPVYPAIAKSAHVSGTVVLHANISKWGTIENLRFITGPVMLRQAAMNAVSTWRYKPYLLNGQPVEVETTVSVVFSMPGE
jgi:periplasmic protein TonB